MVVVDIVDEVVLGIGIMNAYLFAVDLRENGLRFGHSLPYRTVSEKIRFWMGKMVRLLPLIKQVTLAEEKVYRCG